MEPRATKSQRRKEEKQKSGQIFSHSSYDIGWCELTERSENRARVMRKIQKSVCPADIQ